MKHPKTATKIAKWSREIGAPLHRSLRHVQLVSPSPFTVRVLQLKPRPDPVSRQPLLVPVCLSEQNKQYVILIINKLPKYDYIIVIAI